MAAVLQLQGDFERGGALDVPGRRCAQCWGTKAWGYWRLLTFSIPTAYQDVVLSWGAAGSYQPFSDESYPQTCGYVSAKIFPRILFGFAFAVHGFFFWLRMRHIVCMLSL